MDAFSQYSSKRSVACDEVTFCSVWNMRVASKFRHKIPVSVTITALSDISNYLLKACQTIVNSCNFHQTSVLTIAITVQYSLFHLPQKVGENITVPQIPQKKYRVVKRNIFFRRKMNKRSIQDPPKGTYNRRYLHGSNMTSIIFICQYQLWEV